MTDIWCFHFAPVFVGLVGFNRWLLISREDKELLGVNMSAVSDWPDLCVPYCFFRTFSHWCLTCSQPVRLPQGDVLQGFVK